METVNLAIIEDDFKYAAALRTIINGSPELNCIGVFESGELAVPNILKNPPDIVLTDIQLPGISGIECIQQLKKEIPSLQLMVLSHHGDGAKVYQALEAGASGYILKNTRLSKIIDYILDLNNGGAPMSAEIARQVVHFFNTSLTPYENKYKNLLTKREKEVLALISQGLSYKQVGAKLFTGVENIKSHCHNIYGKLHVKNAMAAVRKVYMDGACPHCGKRLFQ